MADRFPTSFHFSQRAHDALQYIAKVTGMKKQTIVETALIKMAAWVKTGWPPEDEGGEDEADRQIDRHADNGG